MSFDRAAATNPRTALSAPRGAIRLRVVPVAAVAIAALVAIALVFGTGVAGASTAGASMAGASTAGASTGAASAGRTSYNLTARYTVTANLDWANAKIAVDITIDLQNTSGGPVTRLALNTVAAALGAIHVTATAVGGHSVTPTITGQTIFVPLSPTLAAGAVTRVRVAYRATLRRDGADMDWMFDVRNGIVDLYRFIPWLSRQLPLGGTDGDPFVTPVSPYVKVTITADRAMTYATSGQSVAGAGLTQTFVARNVRDFNLAASPTYHVLTGTSSDGKTQIRVFTRTANAALLLRAARQALAAFDDWIGPYAYPYLNVAQSGAGYAMESPALIWIPTGLTDDVASYVTHEVAHQWFYAAVGNDQVTSAFADEALAEFLTFTLDGGFRSSACAKARLDLSIYVYSSDCYYEVIYVQGANFLESLRNDMGDAAFWDSLSAYYDANQFRISSDRRLLEAFRSYAGDWVLPRYHARFPSLY